MFDNIPLRLRTFWRREEITFKKLCSPPFVLDLLIRYKYIHFLVIGVTGLGLALLIIFLLTEFVFGRENYYTAYLIGLVINLTYNFVLHTLISFRTQRKHVSRFIVFIVYNLLMASFQATVVGFVTPIIGVDFYIFIIATVVFIFSIINYLVFKLVVFFEQYDQEDSRSEGSISGLTEKQQTIEEGNTRAD